LKTATAKDAAYAPAHYYLGNQLVKAGDFGGAVAEYQAFLKLEPNGPLAKSVQAKLKDAKAHAH
jgi:cytochrome c-type biogenesis protein CcmH/NrfG